jgi:hypothetical protein
VHTQSKRYLKRTIMKVLLVFKEGETDNLFVETLYKGIKQEGIDIEVSANNFWNDNYKYDIIHFQWPEEIVNWNYSDSDIASKIKDRILILKSKGTKFVYTRHNERSHYANHIVDDIYKIVESHCDIVIHMGNFSLKQFAKEYPKSVNIIIPHHIYESTYELDITQNSSRRALHIPNNKFVITAFGKFRNTQEIMLVLKAFWKCNINNKMLLAPRMLPFSKNNKNANLIKRGLSILGYYLIIPLLKMLNIYTNSNDILISNKDLPFYFSASDIIFIQRLDILNSGNIPMAFLFKKVVIGPNTGNIGELLVKTQNPTFNPYNSKSVVEAIKNAYILNNNKHGVCNYEYAKQNMALKNVCNQYINVYKSLMV